MRLLTILSVALFSINSFAAGQLTCNSEDGSSFTAAVYSDAGSVPAQVKYQIRGSQEQEATVAHYESVVGYINGVSTSEAVKTIVLKDSKTQQIVMVISNGTLVDNTGTYTSTCEFSY